MSLWVDVHRPTSLFKLTIAPDITEKLLALGRSEELPHLLFYGPPGRLVNYVTNNVPNLTFSTINNTVERKHV